MKKLFALIICSLLATTAFAHSGGKDAAGCHTNHKTGEYHCHNGW